MLRLNYQCGGRLGIGTGPLTAPGKAIAETIPDGDPATLFADGHGFGGCKSELVNMLANWPGRLVMPDKQVIARNKVTWQCFLH